jgi:hypothetical protein
MLELLIDVISVWFSWPNSDFSPMNMASCWLKTSVLLSWVTNELSSTIRQAHQRSDLTAIDNNFHVFLCSNSYIQSIISFVDQLLIC